MGRKKKVQPIDQAEEVTAVETEKVETPPEIADSKYETLKKAMLDWINARPSLLQVQANPWLYEEWVQTLRRLIG